MNEDGSAVGFIVHRSSFIVTMNPEAPMKNFNLDAILEAMLKMSERVSDLNFSVGRQPQV
jgi:hypothetical protein